MRAKISRSKLFFAAILSAYFIFILLLLFWLVSVALSLSAKKMQVGHTDAIKIVASDADVSQDTEITLTQKVQIVDGDESMASFSIIGDFNVHYGAKVQCIAAYTQCEVFSSAWTVESSNVRFGDSSKTWSVVEGSVVFVKRVFGVAVKVLHAEITLPCDQYGASSKLAL